MLDQAVWAQVMGATPVRSGVETRSRLVEILEAVLTKCLPEAVRGSLAPAGGQHGRRRNARLQSCRGWTAGFSGFF